MNAGLFVFSTVLVNGPIMSNAHIENGHGAVNVWRDDEGARTRSAWIWHFMHFLTTF